MTLGRSDHPLKAGLGVDFFTATGFIDEIAAGELVHVPLAEPSLATSEIGLLSIAHAPPRTTSAWSRTS